MYLILFSFFSCGSVWELLPLPLRKALPGFSPGGWVGAPFTCFSTLRWDFPLLSLRSFPSLFETQFPESSIFFFNMLLKTQAKAPISYFVFTQVPQRKPSGCQEEHETGRAASSRPPRSRLTAFGPPPTEERYWWWIPEQLSRNKCHNYPSLIRNDCHM